MKILIEMAYSSLFDYSYIGLYEGTATTTLLYCTTLILFLFLRYKRHHSLIKKLEKDGTKLMPSPPKIPIIGHIYLLRDHEDNPWEGFEQIRKSYGDTVSLRMGVCPMALVSSNKAMREILLDKPDTFSDRPNFARHNIIFGGDRKNSLALCDWSQTHVYRRRMCKKGILPHNLSPRSKLLESIITRSVINFMDSKFRDNCKSAKKIFKLTKEDVLFLTSDIFLDFLCSENYSHDNPDYRDFVHGCDFVFWDINQSYLIDFLPYLTSLGIGFNYLRRLKRVTDFMRDFIEDKIFNPRMKKISASAGRSESKAQDHPGQIETEDYLDSIIIEHLSQCNSMTDADYKVGFADLLAGHAAVANILMRLLGHLAIDKKIQDMISEEARQADLENISHIPSLPITEASIMEALRLGSSPIVPHVAREDTSIDNFHVPKGTMVLFNSYHLNLSDELWTNPLEFDPLRFIQFTEDENGVRSCGIKKPDYFMPFSVGLRACLGYKMVQTISIVLTANLCRSFVFEANDEKLVKQLLSPRGSIALNPDLECFELQLHPR